MITTAQNRLPVAPARRGFVLIVVLWAVAIVTVIAIGFGRRAILDTRAATYSLDYAQAMMLARGAVERGIVEVRNKVFMDAIEKNPPAGTHLGQPWAKFTNLLQDDLYFSTKDRGEKDIVAFQIEDAERYVNINLAPEELLRNMKAISPSTMRKIIARRTKEINPGEGVTSFQAVEELRYFDGVDEEDWFGKDNEPGLVDLLSVAGNGRINVNTASAAVLRSVPGFPADLANRITAYCRGEDGKVGTDDDRGFKSQDDLQAKLGVSGESLTAIGQYCTFESSYFIITGVATRQGGKVRASCTATVLVEGGNAIVIAWKEDVLGA